MKQQDLSWKKYITDAYGILAGISVTQKKHVFPDPEAGFLLWKDWTLTVRERKKSLYLIGNGASASMASHFATDLAKNGRIKTRLFSDMSLLTAIGNDISFDEIYAEPLRWDAEEGDMLIAISSSGNSSNIVKAVHVGNTMGLNTITISAMQEDNAIRLSGDLNFYIKAETYGSAESGHAMILHYWMDLIENGGV